RVGWASRLPCGASCAAPGGRLRADESPSTSECFPQDAKHGGRGRPPYPMHAVLLALPLAISCATRAATEIAGVAGQQLFTFGYREAPDFSGVTWAGGNDYFTVSDKVRAIFPMNIALDSSSGRILNASIGAAVPVKTKLADFEGIAFVPDTRRLYVSAETGD